VTFLVRLLGLGDASPRADGQSSLVQDVAAGVRSVFQRPWIAAVMLQGMAQVAFVTGPVIVCPSV
jgi:hypothetical protein